MRYHDERLRWLQENFSYIDSVTMIDATGKITVKERYNPRYSDAENAADNEWCLNRNLLEVFPSLSHSDSSLLQALQKGELLYRENQCTINHSGKKSVTNNVTFPIISRGKIIGAVELSRDVTHYEGERTAPAARPTPKRRSGTEAKWTLEDIVTQNSKMLEIKRTIAKVADSRSSVLVYGETGTGKELIVSALHNAGSRKDQPFVAVNCAALPESILEGLLFGSRWMYASSHPPTGRSARWWPAARCGRIFCTGSIPSASRSRPCGGDWTISPFWRRHLWRNTAPKWANR